MTARYNTLVEHWIYISLTHLLSSPLCGLRKSEVGQCIVFQQHRSGWWRWGGKWFLSNALYELLNVIHEDRGWCFGNFSLSSLDLTILSLVPEFRNLTLDSPQIRLIVNRSNSVLDIRSVFLFLFQGKISLTVYFITEKMTWMDIPLLAASWPELFPVIWHNKTWQNYMNIRSNISQLLWSVMNLSHITYIYNIE